MFQEGLLTELDQAIMQAHQLVGTRSLIYYLNRIKEDFDFRTDNQFKLIESLVMHDLGLKSVDVYDSLSTNIKVVNARRIIVYLINQYTNIGIETTCSLLNIKKRTYNRYRETMLELMHNPTLDTTLYKKYEKINNLLKTTL